MSIPPYQTPPKQSLEDWWNELQANFKNSMYQYGLSRQQQLGKDNPVNRWDTNRAPLTPDSMRPLFGDQVANDMAVLSKWYQQKIIPLWQQLAKFDKSLQNKK